MPGRAQVEIRFDVYLTTESVCYRRQLFVQKLLLMPTNLILVYLASSFISNTLFFTSRFNTTSASSSGVSQTLLILTQLP